MWMILEISVLMMFLSLLSFSGPSPPTNFSLVTVTVNSLTLNWTPPVGNYRSLQVSINNDLWNVTNPIQHNTSDVQSTTVERLDPNTLYHIRIRSVSQLVSESSSLYVYTSQWTLPVRDIKFENNVNLVSKNLPRYQALLSWVIRKMHCVRSS